MPVLHIVLFAAALTVAKDQAPLRSGCDASEEVVAKLPAGSPVEIRFAMSGSSETCYKVAVSVGGKNLSGYLGASALAGLDGFEKGLHDAPSFDVRKEMTGQVAAIQAKTTSGTGDHALLQASRLLDEHQPQAALDVIETAMRTTGRDARYLTLGGIAAYESDQAKKALDLFKEARELHEDAMLDGWIARLEKEIGGDRSGERLYGTHFLLRYEGGVLDPDVARTMSSILEDEYARISLQLGCRTEERIITIVQSAQNYRASTGGPEWNGGQYDGKIRVPVIDNKSVSPRTRQIFAHEIVHACLTNLGEFPAWFHEGMAQKFSNEPLPAATVEVIKQLIRQKKMPKLEALSGGFGGMSSLEAAVAYAYSRMAADAFVELYRAYGIQNVLRNPERLPRVQEELDRILLGE